MKTLLSLTMSRREAHIGFRTPAGYRMIVELDERLIGELFEAVAGVLQRQVLYGKRVTAVEVLGRKP